MHMKSLFNFIKKFRYSVAICVAALILTLTSVYTMNAAGLPFGGFVAVSLPCTCTPGSFLITVGPPLGGQFVYVSGVPQYANMQLPRAGVWSVGMYSPAGVCMIYSGKSCVPLGVPIGTITPFTGTSF